MFRHVAISPTELPRLPKAGIKEAEPSSLISGKSWADVKGDYTIIGPLDDYGIVVLAKDASGKSWAIKRVDPIDKLECRFMTEVYLKTKLAPQLKECGKDYIVMELIEGETLSKWVKKVGSAQTLIGALRTLLALVGEFDSLGIVHGDLHGRNIIVTKDGWRVIDFEHARRGSQSEDDSFCYAALDIIAQLKKAAPEIANIKYDCSVAGLEDYIEKLESALAPAATEENTSALLGKLFI